jgi:hypothetical protein
MTSYCSKYNCKTNNVNNYFGSGDAMMKKKYGNKFKKISSNANGNGNGNGVFSLNGNSSHTYIGNPNSSLRNDVFSNISVNDCCALKQTNVSVKNYKAYINKKLFCHPHHSANCYKKVNYALIDVSLNKHFRTENRDQSTRTNLLKTKCSVDRTDYVASLLNSKSVGCSVNKVARNNGTTARIDYLKHCNNNVKDNNTINGFTPDYAIYYNDSTLYRKKASCKLYNPPDAKIIAC